jgi:hypothetical protein
VKGVVILSFKIFAREFKEQYWINYYQMSKKYFDSFPESLKTSLDSLDLQEDIKTVVIYRLEDNAKAWLNSGLPILDGIKPVELYRTEEGRRALKEILLMMPD